MVLAAAAVACRMAGDIVADDPGRAAPVPLSGPDRACVTRGEWPSAGLGAVVAAEAVVLAADAATGLPPVMKSDAVSASSAIAPYPVILRLRRSRPACMHHPLMNASPDAPGSSPLCKWT